jgi:UDP-N-acetylmuramoyl-tripeptide--D-alanyl-D-alanine ligase
MEIKTLDGIAQLVDRQVNSTVHITGIAVDSRSVNPGELFWALKGERTDGHCFLDRAFYNGAAAAVVDASYRGPDFGRPLLVVEDTFAALQECAMRVIRRRKSRVVAVTGSLGKTTAKEFITTLLGVKYQVSSSPGNGNSQVGMPLSILNHTSGKEEILVLEMGMTVAGNIKALTRIAPPEVAIVTNVSLVHACNFQSAEEIAFAKGEIFCQPETKIGVIPYDSPHHVLLTRQGDCEKRTVSIESPRADYFLDPKGYLTDRPGKTAFLTGAPPLLGSHNRYNFLTAAAVALYFNVSLEEIALQVPNLRLPDKRLQIIRHKGICFINDAYNAAEDSVKGALEAMPHPGPGGRKIAVLGGMAELGKFSFECHTRVGEYALNRVESVYCLGEECGPICEIFLRAGKKAELFFERERLVEKLRAFLRPSDVVLLKGSNSKELWKIVEEF